MYAVGRHVNELCNLSAFLVFLLGDSRRQLWHAMADIGWVPLLLGWSGDAPNLAAETPLSHTYDPPRRAEPTPSEVHRPMPDTQTYPMRIGEVGRRGVRRR